MAGAVRGPGTREAVERRRLLPPGPKGAERWSGHVERIRLLSEAAQDLLAADDPDDMLQRLFRRARKSLPIDVYFNFMVDADGRALHLASSGGVSAEVAHDLRRLEFGQAVCGTVAASGEPLCVSDIQESDAPLTALVRSLGIRVYACNPLRVGDRVLGTLSFGSRTCDRFGDEDLELFRAICRCVTSAYQRLRSEEALRESEAALRWSREKLVDKMRLLEEQDRRRGEFLAMLGHELRNPLAVLRNGIDVLDDDACEPEVVADVTRRMGSQARHLGRLVDDLLEVARLARGKVTLRKQVCELGDVVEESLAALRPRLDARSQELVREVPAGLRVEADPDRLGQVLTNLVDNAVEHTPEGGRIEVRVGVAESGIELRVLDQGAGVSEELGERVFEAFAQGRGTTRGLGLGLAVVRQLVTLHGGEVWVAGRPEGGSEFGFRIPGPCEAPVEDARAPQRLEGPAAAAPAAERPRVLIVDDNQDAVFTLGVMLRRRGCEVRGCSRGAEALEAARAQRPHAILLDLGLPDIDGFAVARGLREEPALKGARIIAVSGFGDEDTVRAVREGDFDDMVLKPANVDALMDRIRPGR